MYVCMYVCMYICTYICVSVVCNCMAWMEGLFQIENILTVILHPSLALILVCSRYKSSVRTTDKYTLRILLVAAYYHCNCTT